jgi:hypothetical protein
MCGNGRGPFRRRQGKHSSSILAMDGAPFPKVAAAQAASLSLIVVSFLGLVTAFILYVVHPDDTKEVLLFPLVMLVSAGSRSGRDELGHRVARTAQAREAA